MFVMTVSVAAARPTRRVVPAALSPTTASAPVPALRLSALSRFPRVRAGMTAPQAATGFVIAAVLRYADVREELEDGRVRLSLSAPARALAAGDTGLHAALTRLSDVAVVWDERADEVVEVEDRGRVRALCWADEDDLWLEGRRARAC
jgi:hypothetical protein